MGVEFSPMVLASIAGFRMTFAAKLLDFPTQLVDFITKLMNDTDQLALTRSLVLVMSFSRTITLSVLRTLMVLVAKLLDLVAKVMGFVFPAFTLCLFEHAMQGSHFGFQLSGMVVFSGLFSFFVLFSLVLFPTFKQSMHVSFDLVSLLFFPFFFEVLELFL